MFQINDGRTHLWQWDVNRKVIVNDPSIKQVHFSNNVNPVAYVVEVKNGLADIPNILLQDIFNITCYGYIDEYTKVEQTFTVTPRNKPTDYVYTETDIVRWETIAEDAEKANKEALEAATLATNTATDLYEYVEGHKLTLTDDNQGNVTIQGVETGDDAKYASKEYVDNAIASIDIPVIPENVSYFNNDAGYLTEHQSLADYATKTYVDDAIANIPEGGTTDLSNYYTKTEVDTADSKLQLDIDNLEYHIQNITDPTLALKADKTYVDNQIASFVTMEEVNTAIETALNNIPTAEGGSY